MCPNGRRQPELPQIDAWTLEPRLVVCLGVRDVDLSADRIHRDVEKNGSHPTIRAARPLHRRVRARVDREDVLVGKAESYFVVPDDVALIEPVHLSIDRALAELDDQPRPWRGEVLEIVPRRRQSPAVDRPRPNRGRPIARIECRRVDGVAIRGHRQGARRVGKQGDDGEGRPARRISEIVRVEYPDIGSPDPGRRQFRIPTEVGQALSPVGGGDERTASIRPGKDDVAWLIAHEERPDHARGGEVADVDNAHAVRKMVDDPDLRR